MVAFKPVNIKFMSSSFEKITLDYFSFDIENDVYSTWKWIDKIKLKTQFNSNGSKVYDFQRAVCK